MADFGVTMPNTAQIQTGGTYVFWIIIGCLCGALLLWIMYTIYKNMLYRMRCIIYDKVGNTELIIKEKVMETKLEDGMVMYHYKKINKYSPKFDAKYNKLIREEGFLGLFPKFMLGFSVYKMGDKIIPITVRDNPGLEPIDYDGWNYLIPRLRMNQEKYLKNQEFYKILPFIAIGGIIIMFLLGSYFWGKHVENVAKMILDKTGEFFMKGAEVSGQVQVIGK